MIKLTNWKQNIIVPAALIGLALPLVNPESAEASKVHYLENVTVTNAGYYYATDQGELPLVLQLKHTHPDYEYYRNKGMHVNGNVYVYLQIYKDSIFYYSPIIRDKANKGTRPDGTVNYLTRELLSRLEGTSYYPKYNQTEENLRRNTPQYNHVPSLTDPTGNHPVYRNSQNQYANEISDLNHKRGNTDDHNFRRYSGKEWARYAWTKNSLVKTTTGYPKRHADTNQMHNGQRKWGEYRDLGYYTSGINISNPHFPADGLRANGRPGFESYPLKVFPWTKSEHRGSSLHSEIDELAFQYAMYTNKMGLSSSGWNSATYNRFYNRNTNWDKAREAYLIKRDGMTALYDESSSVRQNIARSENGGYSNRSQAIEALTVLYGSLQSKHLGYDQNVSVSFANNIPSYRNGRVLWYTVTLTLPGEQTSNRVHDTRVSRQEVFRNGTSLQVFTRNKNNETSLNTTYAPEVEPGQKLLVRTNVEMVNPFRNAMQGELNMSTNRGHRTKYRRRGGGNIRMAQDNIFEHTITVPDIEGPLDVLTWLDKDQYTRTFDMLWLNNQNNAVNKLNVIIDRGDFSQENIQIIDLNGNVVSNPVAGETYKLRYNYRYLSVNDKDARRTTDVRVDYNIGREVVGSSFHGKDSSGTLSTATRTIQPIHNRVYSFDTDYHVFETAQLDTSSSLVVAADRYDQDSTNNSQSNRWTSRYDLEVRNVRVLPSKSTGSHPNEGTALVQFDVYYDVPNHVGAFGRDVDFLVNMDGRSRVEEMHVRKGLNRNLSLEMPISLTGNNQTIPATVYANPMKEVYETDISTQENNVGTAHMQVENEGIQPYRDNNRRVTWNQYVHENNYQGADTQYSTFNNILRRFTKFATGDNPTARSRAVHEEYKIESVMFRSRMTRQENMGVGGWVDLMKQDGVIRAGYGYELKINVSYNTNAFDEAFHNITGANGRWTRPQLTRPNLQDNIYVLMPGDDGVIRSAQGDGDTEKALHLVEKDESNGYVYWSFEIDGGESLGTETVGRFYIDENVADGRYSLDVFTPKVRGVSGKMTSSEQVLEHLLYDSQYDLGIQVIGSSTDDISDHINR